MYQQDSRLSTGLQLYAERRRYFFRRRTGVYGPSAITRPRASPATRVPSSHVKAATSASRRAMRRFALAAKEGI
jgi:hypothetical protein